MDKKTELEICEKYRNNFSTVQLSKEYGVSCPTISKILKKNGEEIRSRSDRQKVALQTGRSPPLNRKWDKKRREKHSERMKKVYDSLPQEKIEEHREKSRIAYEQRSEEEKKRLTKLGSESSIRATKIGSKAERYLAAALKKNGYKIKFHCNNIFYGEKLQIDMMIPSIKVVIEVDGPTHYSKIFGVERLEKQRIADNRKNGLVMDHGFVMIRIRNDKKNFTDFFGERMANRVLEILEEIKREFPPREKRLFHIDVT